jgi:hypothetical protein
MYLKNNIVSKMLKEEILNEWPMSFKKTIEIIPSGITARSLSRL